MSERNNEGIEVSLGNWDRDGNWIPLAYHDHKLYTNNPTHMTALCVGEHTACNNNHRVDVRAGTETHSHSWVTGFAIHQWWLLINKN